MLKKDLNDIFISCGKNPQAQDEVDLFRALIEVMNKRHFAYAKEFHKGYVKHLLQFNHDAPTERRCEIADVLMLFIDGEGNMRYTFLQNKRDKKIKYNPLRPLKKVKADAVQWDLLHNRCVLSDTLTTGLSKNCLSSAILDSAATYGIFLNENHSNYVEMSYNIARDLEPTTKRKIAENSSDRTYKILTAYNRVYTVNGYLEIGGTTTLDDFERAAQAMLVGSPIEAGNSKHIEFAEAALSYAYTCLREERNRGNYEENHEGYFQLLSRCAERYRISMQKEVDLPYSLVVIKAKNKYFATSSYFMSKIFKDCKVICDPRDIYSKLGDKDSFVIIDPYIIEDFLRLSIPVDSDKNWLIAEPYYRGVIMKDILKYFIKRL